MGDRADPNGRRGGGKGGKGEKRDEKRGDSDRRKGDEGRGGVIEVNQSGGDRGGSQTRDPQELPTAPAPSLPHPIYQNQQRFTPGSITDIPQGPPIPPFQPIPNYYQQPPIQTPLPLPPLQTPFPPYQGISSAVHQAMLELQRRYNLH